LRAMAASNALPPSARICCAASVAWGWALAMAAAWGRSAACSCRQARHSNSASQAGSASRLCRVPRRAPCQPRPGMASGFAGKEKVLLLQLRLALDMGFVEGNAVHRTHLLALG